MSKENKIPVHYQRVGQYLTAGCGRRLGAGPRTSEWSIDHDKVTCPKCLVAIEAGKEEG